MHRAFILYPHIHYYISVQMVKLVGAWSVALNEISHSTKTIHKVLYLKYEIDQNRRSFPIVSDSTLNDVDENQF